MRFWPSKRCDSNMMRGIASLDHRTKRGNSQVVDLALHLPKERFAGGALTVNDSANVEPILRGF